jgi:hypothetical protein
MTAPSFRQSRLIRFRYTKLNVLAGLGVAILFLVLNLMASAAVRATEVPALDIISLGTGFDYTQGRYSLGWRFTANQDLIVTQIGFYDDLKNGLVESHDVGIFDVATKALMASTTVVPTDPLTGFFRYHPLAAPVTLPGGHDYYCMAVTKSEHYAVAATNLAVDGAITFRGYAGYNLPGTGQSNQTDVLTCADDDTVASPYAGDFGASFLITNPQPAGAAVDILFGQGGKGTDSFQQAFSLGYTFRPTSDIQVATLGYYDDKQDGFKDSGGHNVAIFNLITKSLVISTQVTSSDPLRGFFRYHPVAPVTLSAGTDYVIMGANSTDNYLTNVQAMAIDSAITLTGDAFSNSPPTLGADYPTQLDPGKTPFFGPTFELPSPSSTSSNVPNILQGAPPITVPLTVPLGGLSVAVASSDAGLIQLNIDDSKLTLARSNYDLTTDFGDISGRNDKTSGTHPVHQFINHGIFVATSVATNRATGQPVGMARITLPMSSKETGDFVPKARDTTPRIHSAADTNTAITTKSLKGKFAFNGGTLDRVTYSGSIVLPIGFTVGQPHEFWLAIGNIVVQTTIDKNGKGTIPGTPGVLKSLKVMTKAKKGTVTTGLETATVTATYSTQSMVDNGFGTEGISNKATDVPKGQSVTRMIQVAILLDGSPFQTLTQVDFSLSSKSDFGVISSPAQKK